jgi:hypothetical protein
VSWSLVVLPLHAVLSPRDDSPARPLPRVLDVLRACHTAGGHGTAEFTVDGLDVGSLLPPCDNPARCALGGSGDDLGEVSVHVVGQGRRAGRVAADAVVDAVGFRTPDGTAALRTVCALTAVAGALFVCDDAGGPVRVVWPHDHYERLAPAWPW